MNKTIRLFIFSISLLFQNFIFAKNLHPQQSIHEDIVAAQELITLGCMGKLSIKLNFSGEYSQDTIQKLQICANNEGSDIVVKTLTEYKNGEISKESATTDLLYYSVIFAKMNNPDVEKIPTEDLINAARKKGKEHHPYVKEAD